MHGTFYMEVLLRTTSSVRDHHYAARYYSEVQWSELNWVDAMPAAPEEEEEKVTYLYYREHINLYILR